MKRLNRLALIYSCALGLLMTNACTDKFDLWNTDPNLVTAELIDPALILTNVETGITMGNSTYGDGLYGELCGMSHSDYGGDFREIQSTEEWEFEYTSQVNNLSIIIQLIAGKVNAADLVNETAIARILKVWSFSKLTDTYGDIPYTQSCLPADKAILQPKYDTQDSIYADFFKELKEAAAQLDASKVSFGAADLIYGGDVTKWKKLANSLRLRLALRVRYASPEMAHAALSDLSEADLMVTQSDDAYLKNSDAYPDQLNPRYFHIINQNTTQESVHTHMVMINILKNDSLHMDPRIAIYADTVMAPWKGGLSPNGYFFPAYKYRGQPTLGNTSVEFKYPWNLPTSSDLAEFWRVPIVSISVLKSSEVFFNLAEAKLAGLLPSSFSGTANDYYEKGIDNSIAWYKWFYALAAPQIADLMISYIHNPAYNPGAQWTQTDVDQYLAYKRIKDVDVTAFKTTPIYTLSGSDDHQLEMIINQKIVGLYPDEFQGWCEYRRTGYPKIPIGPDINELKGVVPRREEWPTAEKLNNLTQYNVALARLGKDSRLSKMWWDSNPAAPHIYVWTAPQMPTPWQ